MKSQTLKVTVFGIHESENPLFKSSEAEPFVSLGPAEPASEHGVPWHPKNIEFGVSKTTKRQLNNRKQNNMDIWKYGI